MYVERENATGAVAERLRLLFFGDRPECRQEPGKVVRLPCTKLQKNSSKLKTDSNSREFHLSSIGVQQASFARNRRMLAKGGIGLLKRFG